MAGNFITDFFEGPDVGTFNDPYTAQLQQIQSQLQSGQLGKDVASQATGSIRRQAGENLRSIANSGVGRNAAVLSRLTDKTQTTADQGIIGAQVEGEQINQRALGQAAQIGESNRNFAYNDFERKEAERRQPSPFESLLTTAVGTLAGGGITSAISGLLGGGDKGNNTTTTTPTPSYESLDFPERDIAGGGVDLGRMPQGIYNPNPNNLPWSRSTLSGWADLPGEQ